MLPTESVLSNKSSNSAAQSSGWERAGKRLGIVIYVLLCIEIGTFLLVVPWSVLWDRSLLMGYYPGLRPLLLSPYVRGAVSGLGLVNLWLAVSQAWYSESGPSRRSAGN